MVFNIKGDFRKEMSNRTLDLKEYPTKALERDEVWENAVEAAFSMYEEVLEELKNEKEKNKKLEVELKEIKEKYQNVTVKKRGRKKVSLTDKQKEFIKDLTLNAKATKETIVYLFNQKYNKREKPLTVHQLRTIMNDMELKKPKR